jgi:hypothetical protein
MPNIAVSGPAQPGSFVLNPSESLLEEQALSLERLGPLLEAVFNSSLPRSRALREGGTAAKRTSRSRVSDPHNAHIVDAGNGPVAGHTRRHLHRQGELTGGRQAQAPKPDARDVLRHLGRLERGRVRAARRAVDGGLEWAGTVLVDLGYGVHFSIWPTLVPKEWLEDGDHGSLS